MSDACRTHFKNRYGNPQHCLCTAGAAQHHCVNFPASPRGVKKMSRSGIARRRVRIGCALFTRWPIVGAPGTTRDNILVSSTIISILLPWVVHLRGGHNFPNHTTCAKSAKLHPNEILVNREKKTPLGTPTPRQGQHTQLIRGEGSHLAITFNLTVATTNNSIHPTCYVFRLISSGLVYRGFRSHVPSR